MKSGNKNEIQKCNYPSGRLIVIKVSFNIWVVELLLSITKHMLESLALIKTAAMNIPLFSEKHVPSTWFTLVFLTAHICSSLSDVIVATLV